MSGAESSELLRQLFEAAGYRVTLRPGGWSATRSRDRRSVVFSEEVRSPTELEGAFAPDAIHRVLLYVADPGTVARSLAAERGVEVFDTATIGSALGELLLLPPSPPAESSGALGGGPLEPPPAIYPEGERIVRGRIAQPEAERIAAAPGLRASLKLVPFYVAPYRVRTPAPHGGRSASSEHIVAVNGLLRAAEGWDAAQYEFADPSTDPSPRLEPNITVDQALPVALDWVRSNHTVRVEHTEQHSGTVVVETRRVPPAADDIRLAPLTLVYVPFWYLEGEDGRVVIDAVTGRTRSTNPIAR